MTDNDQSNPLSHPHGNNTADVAGTTDTTQATVYNDDHSLAQLADEVQCLVGETSEKFIPAPTHDQILSDAIEGLCRFKEVVQWKDFFRSKRFQEELERCLCQTSLPMHLY
jgi:hypothetical protein